MKVSRLAEILNAEIINLSEDREIETGYCGDFLSFAMSRLPSNSAWFTVMSNANVAAVAVLTEAAAIVVCENVRPDENLSARCKTEGLNLLIVAYPAYECAVKLSQALKNE
ncbi:MAG: hypothetical protein LBT30_00325 [Clostridiales bacterium]|nr:hypothetical protein [Clostridiales bacterium]